MKNQSSQKSNNQNEFRDLFTGMTTSKSSGLIYLFATVLPSVLAFFVMIILAMLGVLQEGYEKTDWYVYMMYVLSPVSFAALVVLYGKMTKQTLPLLVKKQACSWKYYLVALLLQFGLFSLSQLNGWFITWLQNFGYEPTGVPIPSVDGWGVLGVLFVIALLPAIFEEAIFRGILLNGLKSFGKVGAVLLCGGLFSLYHQNPEQTIYQFCCGAAYALVAMKAGSILPTMLAHFINNALIILMYKWGVPAISETGSVALMIASVLCLIGTLTYLIVFDKKESAPIPDAKTDRKEFLRGAALGIFVCLAGWVAGLW